MVKKATANHVKAKRSSFLVALKKQRMAQSFVIAGMLFLFVFRYIPMFGILMAFKKYSISTGIAGIFTSKWAGFDHFIEFFTDYKFGTVVRNTLVISLLKLLFSFPAPILLAIMLNEVRRPGIKRFAQTVSYLPHFISWVIVAGIAGAFFSETRGFVNTVLTGLNIIKKPIPILTNPKYYWALAVGSGIWKTVGWWSIIFLAAIASIDPILYESAVIDGAGRLRRIWHITLPSMKSSIVVVLILSIGNMLGGGLGGSTFQQSLLLGNPMNNPTSEVIQTYAFKTGMVDGRFDYATAIELVQAVISVTLIFSSNYISKKVAGSGLF